jgi:hypothetical protein
VGPGLIVEADLPAGSMAFVKQNWENQTEKK